MIHHGRKPHIFSGKTWLLSAIAEGTAFATNHQMAITIAPQNNLKTRESLAKQSNCFCMAKTKRPRRKKYSLLTAELKYRRDILCGAELCALHL